MSANEKEELAYSAGARAAWARVLQTAVKELGDEAPESASLLLEREQATAALRTLCADFGDNDWPDDLHLADVIEKHLGKHLHTSVPESARAEMTPEERAKDWLTARPIYQTEYALAAQFRAAENDALERAISAIDNDNTETDFGAAKEVIRSLMK